MLSSIFLYFCMFFYSHVKVYNCFFVTTNYFFVGKVCYILYLKYQVSVIHYQDDFGPFFPPLVACTCVWMCFCSPVWSTLKNTTKVFESSTPESVWGFIFRVCLVWMCVFSFCLDSWRSFPGQLGYTHTHTRKHTLIYTHMETHTAVGKDLVCHLNKTPQ